MRDPAGVACEPFRQWVIEDNFVAGRPEWEKAGAELVSDVLPYEEMKLRMLNGSHSFLAYLGYLAGYQHINDCMEDEHYRYAAYGLMLQEQAPTLKVQGVDLQDYANRLIARYSNPALRHRTWQIAMDGSQKLPQRMLDSVRWHLAHDSKFDLLALGVAGWMRYVGGVDEQGNPIEISDPLLPVIQKAVQSSAEGKARVQSLLAIKAIFGDDADFASLYQVRTGSHGPTDLSPVCMAAALHFDLWVPNFGVQEYMGYSEQMLEVFPHNWTFDNGYMHPGDKPGLGIEFDEKLAAKYPYEPAYLPVARLEDGTLWNW